jgi:hypothetical protein
MSNMVWLFIAFTKDSVLVELDFHWHVFVWGSVNVFSSSSCNHRACEHTMKVPYIIYIMVPVSISVKA